MDIGEKGPDQPPPPTVTLDKFLNCQISEKYNKSAKSYLIQKKNI